MKRVLICLGVLAGVLAAPVPHASASWSSIVCHGNNSNDPQFKRADARAYAYVAKGEGYEYAGGCWNDNNIDDTPNQPDSGGEGPDCSGLVFKAWELKNAWGAPGGQWWDRIQDIHGPYSSTSFHNAGTGGGLPFFQVAKSNALYMDAFARDGHVGLLYSSYRNSDGTYNFIQAKGDSYGTNIWGENWMSDSDYRAIRRRGWTADCYPSCAAATPAEPVIVR
ncbi:MAG: hypothetical protein ABR600_00750 [Actinomycetota bacterium]